MAVVTGGAGSDAPTEEGWRSRSALLALGRAGTLVLQAAQLALVARLLSPTEFGSWAAATALVMVASALADCGLGPISVMYLATPGASLDDVVAANAVAMVGATLLTCAASTIFGWQVALATLSLVPWLVLVRIQGPSMSVLQQRFRFRRTVVGDALGTAVQTALLGALLLLAGTSGETTRVLLTGACLVIGAAVELKVVLVTRIWPTRASLRGRGWVRLLRSAASLGVVNGVSMLHSKVDQLALALLVSRATLGGYAVAYRVIDAGVALASVASRAGFSVLANRGEDRAQVVRGMIRMWALIGMAAGLGVWVTAPVLMPLVGGSGYPEAPQLLRILAPIVAVAAINNAAAQAVIADRSVLPLLRISIMGLVANATLCLTLIPRFGAPGAGVASLVTESLGMLIVVGMARRIRLRDEAAGPGLNPAPRRAEPSSGPPRPSDRAAGSGSVSPGRTTSG
jgi:O-antigen/teichoic acid export membrane protein